MARGLVWLRVALAATLTMTACGDDDDAAPDAAVDAEVDAPDVGVEVPVPPIIGEVEETSRTTLPGLRGPAHVVYAEANVPHIYAADPEDLARVFGYVVARDRWFEMDMARRLSQGRLSELLGDAALDVDLESRGTGMTLVAERILARFDDDQRARFAAFAEGANAYAAAVRGRREEPPQEFRIAAPLFGTQPGRLMADFELIDVAAVAATITYQLGFETTDVGRERGLQLLADEGRYAGEPGAELREAGLLDAFFRVTNSNGYASARGWGLATSDAIPLVSATPRALPRARPGLGATLERLLPRLARIDRRLGRTHDEGFGSNAWAVAAARTSDGAALLAGDGHLPGSVPTLFYRVGLDTRLLGEGDVHQLGLAFPGVPLMAVGTNGRVAWSQTQFFGDITDWYTEEITLDASGAPASLGFGAEARPLVAIDDDITVADVPALGSVGRTERVIRYETFDGRLLTAIEGRSVSGPDAAGPGETAVRLLGDWIIPGDEDGDGTIRGVTFDYTALDGPNFALTLDAWGKAETVESMRESSRALVAYSQNIAAADATGSVMYLAYQGMPCRAQLRDGDGRWEEGGHPGFLLDGTRFAGFTLPLTPEGRVDEAAGTTPQTCVVPFDEYPGAIDPDAGFVVNANNDPGTMTAANDLAGEPHYIGGPWHEDFRAARIADRLRARTDHDEDSMAELQADVRSPLGALMVPLLLGALDDAEALAAAAPPLDPDDGRLAALWQTHEARFTEARNRLRTWRDRGFVAASGVQTFYHPTVDDAERSDSVATTIFNAWLGPFDQRVLGDERFPPSTFTPTGSGGRMRTMTRLIEGRGAGNPLGLASYDPTTEESIFFDVLGTPERETSREVALLALADALDFLMSEPAAPAQGGFGTANMDAWLWGLRHTTRFDALIAQFLAGDDSLAVLGESFSITPDTLPLWPDLTESDPRHQLTAFPRPGDNFTVDAANSGFSGTRFTYGSIAVFRMVVALRGDDTTGRDVLPGGQSGIPMSPHYADQAALWLGNETTPMRFGPTAVVEGATGREVFIP